MILVNKWHLEPTIFPDGTSQVWKLPEHIMGARRLDILWKWETPNVSTRRGPRNEAEIIDLLSLRRILPEAEIHLKVPYLPYARQDKVFSNESTFNLRLFADLVNMLRCKTVSAVDVHNPDICRAFISGFQNIGVDHIHELLMKTVKPDYVVYPDAGAKNRYRINAENRLIFYKERDPTTGDITGYGISRREVNGHGTIQNETLDFVQDHMRFLIVDDICDGGATFVGIAKKLHESGKMIDIYLFVTHGIFSRGLSQLKDLGLKIITTDSLSQQFSGADQVIEVCR